MDPRDRDGITRRDFVRGAGVAAAAIGAAGVRLQGAAAEEAPAKVLNFNEDMEYRRLGKTGIRVSAVCLGGHWKRVETMFAPKGEVSPYHGPRDAGDLEPFLKNRDEVVSKALEVGINYIDACTGTEVMTYAKVLKGRRDKVYLGYSWFEREMRQKDWQTAAKLLQGLDLGLKEAGLDHVDVWRITMYEEPRNQARGTIHTPEHVDAVVEALSKAQKAGKARFVGVSCHDREWLKDLIEKHPEIQVICTPYTAGSKELPKDSLFEAVRKCDVGVFGIKPFASNALFRGDSSPHHPQASDDDERARLALRYILRNDAIAAPIPGLISARQVENAALAVRERRGMDRADARKLEDACREMWARLPEDHAWLRGCRWV